MDFIKGGIIVLVFGVIVLIAESLLRYFGFTDTWEIIVSFLVGVAITYLALSLYHHEKKIEE